MLGRDPPLEPTQCLLGHDAIRNLDQDAVQPGDVTSLIAHPLPLVPKPTDTALSIADAVFARERLQCCVRAVELIDDPLAIIGVEARDPDARVRGARLRRQTQHGLERRAEMDRSLRVVRQPNVCNR